MHGKYVYIYIYIYTCTHIIHTLRCWVCLWVQGSSSLEFLVQGKEVKRLIARRLAWVQSFWGALSCRIEGHPFGEWIVVADLPNLFIAEGFALRFTGG